MNGPLTSTNGDSEVELEGNEWSDVKESPPEASQHNCQGTDGLQLGAHRENTNTLSQGTHDEQRFSEEC
jgi:hypothetical protein